MSTENREDPRIASTLALRVGRNANPAQVAEAVAQMWSEAESALIPIIGREGVAALLRRSAFLSASVHPWFLDSSRNGSKLTDPEALKLFIANQTADEALAGGTTLLSQFYGLLTNLIGPSLAGRILESAWIDLSSGETAQDHSL
jgi:hypothetical protein